MRSSQRGNILFLILLAVVLFAALSYAVTSSMRGGGRNSSEENVKLQAATLLQNLTLMSNTVNRWMLTGGYNNIGQLDFRSNSFGGSIGNSALCTTPACNLFDPAGGGLVPELPASYIEPTSSCAGNANIVPSISNLSVAGIGTDLPDVVMYYACLSNAVCDEINRQTGIWNTGDAYLRVNGGTWGVDSNYYQGNPPTSDTLTPNFAGKDDARVTAQQTFCARLPYGSYMGRLYHVLYAR